MGSAWLYLFWVHQNNNYTVIDCKKTVFSALRHESKAVFFQ